MACTANSPWCELPDGAGRAHRSYHSNWAWLELGGAEWIPRLILVETHGGFDENLSPDTWSWEDKNCDGKAPYKVPVSGPAVTRKTRASSRGLGIAGARPSGREQRISASCDRVNGRIGTGFDSNGYHALDTRKALGHHCEPTVRWKSARDIEDVKRPTPPNSGIQLC